MMSFLLWYSVLWCEFIRLNANSYTMSRLLMCVNAEYIKSFLVWESNWSPNISWIRWTNINFIAFLTSAYSILKFALYILDFIQYLTCEKANLFAYSICEINSQNPYGLFEAKLKKKKKKKNYVLSCRIAHTRIRNNFSTQNFVCMYKQCTVTVVMLQITGENL